MAIRAPLAVTASTIARKSVSKRSTVVSVTLSITTPEVAAAQRVVVADPDGREGRAERQRLLQRRAAPAQHDVVQTAGGGDQHVADARAGHRHVVVGALEGQVGPRVPWPSDGVIDSGARLRSSRRPGMPGSETSGCSKPGGPAGGLTEDQGRVAVDLGRSLYQAAARRPAVRLSPTRYIAGEVGRGRVSTFWAEACGGEDEARASRVPARILLRNICWISSSGSAVDQKVQRVPLKSQRLGRCRCRRTPPRSRGSCVARDALLEVEVHQGDVGP